MKRYNVCLLTLLFSLIFGCKEGGFRVNVKINNIPAQGYKLIDVNNDAQVIAEGKVDDNEAFTIKGNNDEARLYKLQFEQGKSLLLVLHKDDAQIAADWQNLETTINITGSPTSVTTQNLLKRVRQYTTDMQTLTLLMQKMGVEKNAADVITKAKDKMTATQKQFDADLKNCADTSDVVNAVLAASMVQKDSNITWLNNFYSALPTKFTSSAYAKTVSASAQALKGGSAAQAAANTKNTSANAAPDFTLATPNGQAISLSSFKGKYVLVDFWASWCPPCRAENPSVVAAYNKYKDKNFTVFGVSLDDDKSEWQKAILEDGLTWQHGSDLMKWASTVVRLYNIEGIPHNVLLDPQGNIIATALHGAALDSKLAEVLK